jgi:hypothetical protein
MSNDDNPNDPPTTQGTRRTLGSAAQKMREEMLKVSETSKTIRTTEWARKFLDKGMYMPEGEEVTNSHLAFIILQLASTDNIKKAVSDGLKAVALLLEEVENNNKAEKIASEVGATLTALIQNITARNNEPSTDELTTTTTDDLRHAAISLTNTVEEKCEEIQRITEQLVEASENLNTKTRTGSETTETAPKTVTYADAIRNQPPPPQHAITIAKGISMQRQILIDKAPDATTNGLSSLTEKELVLKANLAIGFMEDDAMPEDTAFVGATKLKNGGALLQLNTNKAADWLRGEKATASFLEQMGGTSTIKSRQWNTIVEFVPITFNPNNLDGLREVEKVSGLPRGTIASAKYFKPEHKRKPQQQSAHAMLSFTTREAANHAIEHGLFIESKRVSAHKLLREPRRCVKCQQVGTYHIAAECKSIHDVCARCGEMHKTELCTATDPSAFKCTNCKAKGHGAADRKCPYFMEKLVQVQSRDPENKYRFFPTNDPKTWELIEAPAPQASSQNVAGQAATQENGRGPQEYGNKRGMGRLAGGRPGGGGGTRPRGEWGNQDTQNNRTTEARQTVRGSGQERWPMETLRQPTLGEMFDRGNRDNGRVSWADDMENEYRQQEGNSTGTQNPVQTEDDRNV